MYLKNKKFPTFAEYSLCFLKYQKSHVSSLLKLDFI